MKDIGYEEGPYAAKYGFYRDIAGGREDKDIQAERGCNETDLHASNDDHAEPYRIQPGYLYDRKDKWECKNQGREDIPEASDDNIENDDAEDNYHWVVNQCILAKEIFLNLQQFIYE